MLLAKAQSAPQDRLATRERKRGQQQQPPCLVSNGGDTVDRSYGPYGTLRAMDYSLNCTQQQQPKRA